MTNLVQADYWAECSCGWQTEGTSKALAEEQAGEHAKLQKGGGGQ